jgi:predicted MFS family arabinose efflux permease
LPPAFRLFVSQIAIVHRVNLPPASPLQSEGTSSQGSVSAESSLGSDKVSGVGNGAARDDRVELRDEAALHEDATTREASRERRDGTEGAADPRSDSPWAPLAVPVFRAFWLASIVSNLGTWVHEVGAGWLMTSLDPTPEMVSAVRVAISLPTLLMAIPVGVVADRFDRRQLLIVTQLVLFATTATLASLTFAGMITSWGLLGLTFVIGVAMVFHILSWQSTVPMLVPRRQLSRAIALGSISFNLARAAGPALGGVLIATAGVWIAFGVNAISFAVVLAVLLWWKPEKGEPSHGLTFRLALVEGFRFVTRHQTMRNVLVSVLLFLIPATAMWSLLPLVARDQLGWNATGYGFLVTSLGLGAVFAARFLHWMHHWMRLNRTVALAMGVFALGLAVIGLTQQESLVLLATFTIGATWMLAMTTFNTSAQMTLPNVLRARGMGSYMTVVAGSMSLGSLFWGQIAGRIGLESTQLLAAATMIVAAAISYRWFPIDEV